MKLSLKKSKSKKTLGAYLRRHRLRAGYSQNQVAILLDITNGQFVSNFERGLCAPPPHMLKRLLYIYAIPRMELRKLLVRLYVQELDI